MDDRESSVSADGLLDLSELPLRELWSLDDGALSRALRRIMDSAEQTPAQAVSAFNSAL
jgi:FXSXX-COOH protein